jgi:hypothetical protein
MAVHHDLTLMAKVVSVALAVRESAGGLGRICPARGNRIP